MPSRAPVRFTQVHIMAIMSDLGYPTQKMGMCYGIALMAMQATLAGDLSGFIHRLCQLALLSPGTARAWVALERQLASELLGDEELGPIAAERLGIIVDTLAFFEGIVSYQFEFHMHLLVPPSSAHPSYHSAMPLILPVAIDEHSLMKPFEFFGVYEDTEWADYFFCLMEAVGQQDFSLVLDAGAHAITISYVADLKQLFVCDPNELPGYWVKPMGILWLASRMKNHLLFPDLVPCVTHLFVRGRTRETEARLAASVRAMCAKPQWQNIHEMTPEKLATRSRLHHDVLTVATRLHCPAEAQRFLYLLRPEHFSAGFLSNFNLYKNQDVGLLVFEKFLQLGVSATEINRSINPGPLLYHVCALGIDKIALVLLKKLPLGELLRPHPLYGSALLAACRGKYESIAEALIKQMRFLGARRREINQEDSFGVTPHQVARANSWTRMSSALAPLEITIRIPRRLHFFAQLTEGRTTSSPDPTVWLADDDVRSACPK